MLLKDITFRFLRRKMQLDFLSNGKVQRKARKWHYCLLMKCLCHTISTFSYVMVKHLERLFARVIQPKWNCNLANWCEMTVQCKNVVNMRRQRNGMQLGASIHSWNEQPFKARIGSDPPPPQNWIYFLDIEFKAHAIANIFIFCKMNLITC